MATKTCRYKEVPGSSFPNSSQATDVDLIPPRNQVHISQKKNFGLLYRTLAKVLDLSEAVNLTAGLVSALERQKCLQPAKCIEKN
jgi:hypothetical protein